MYGNESILKNYNPDNIHICVPTPFLDRKFFVKISGKSTTETNKDDVFTDGSKSKEEEEGRGIYIPEYRKNNSYKLPDCYNILQSEISVVRRVVRWLLYYKIFDVSFRFYIDSKAVTESSPVST